MGRKEKPLPPLTDAQRQLVEDHLHVARKVARCVCAQFPGRLPFDDAMQEASRALCVAAHAFDPTRQTFAVFARVVCQGRLRNALQRERRQRRALPFSVVEEDALEPMDCPDHRRRTSPEDADLLEHVQAVLPPDAYGLLAARFLEGRQIREVAASVDSPAQSVADRIRRVIRRVRREMPLAV